MSQQIAANTIISQVEFLLQGLQRNRADPQSVIDLARLQIGAIQGILSALGCGPSTYVAPPSPCREHNRRDTSRPRYSMDPALRDLSRPRRDPSMGGRGRGKGRGRGRGRGGRSSGNEDDVVASFMGPAIDPSLHAAVAQAAVSAPSSPAPAPAPMNESSAPTITIPQSVPTYAVPPPPPQTSTTISTYAVPPFTS